MTKDELIQEVKRIVAVGREGTPDDAYAGYEKLFSGKAFGKCKPEDQRQALRLMIFNKAAPKEPTPAMLSAHRAALAPLTELVSAHGEPADHELLGVCHVMLGNSESASSIFKAGLAIERERNPSSDLCGELMKRVSMI
jgi:hypothetical protein